jgi:DoxX-like family
MNLALWIAQFLLSVAVLATGVAKLVIPKEKLVTKMKWADSWPSGRVKLLGAAEALGAIGVVVPWLTGIAPVLTPVAASCLLVLMGGAVKTHLDLKESPVPPIIVGALCVFVALGRFGVIG